MQESVLDLLLNELSDLSGSENEDFELQMTKALVMMKKYCSDFIKKGTK